MIESGAPTAGPGPCKCEEQYTTGVSVEAADFFRLTRHLPGCPNAAHMLRVKHQKMLESYVADAGRLLSGAIQDRAGFLILVYDPLRPGGWQTYYTNSRKDSTIGAVKEFVQHMEAEDAKAGS